MRYVLALIVIGLIGGTAYGPAEVRAQSSLDLIFGTDLAMDLSSAHPGAGERITAYARSTFLDLSSTVLTWKKNGEVLSSGIGLEEIEITAGALGSETRLAVEASEGGIPFSSAEAVIRPTALELMWEADSYVPPFYRGRALASAGTNLRLEALPRFIRAGGAAITPKDLVFTWKRNGYVIQAASGRGKSTAVIESPSLFGNDIISVEVKTPDGTLGNDASVRVRAQSPRIALYQVHPVFGTTYHQAFSERSVVGESEATFSAIPYFVDAIRPDDASLRYQWKIQGVDIQNDESSPNIITINAENSSGEAFLELALTHATNLFLTAANAWELLFDERATGAPFGSSQ